MLSSGVQHLNACGIQGQDGEAWQTPVPLPQDDAASEDAEVLNDDAWPVWQDDLPMPALCHNFRTVAGNPMKLPKITGRASPCPPGPTALTLVPHYLLLLFIAASEIMGVLAELWTTNAASE